MRRLKSIASGRSSFSDNLGDSVTKRAKLEEELENRAVESTTEASSSSAGGAQVSERSMASAGVGPITAPKLGNPSAVSATKAGPSGVEQLPKEMHEMTIRDHKAESSEDKEIEVAVVDGNGAETGHIIVTTIGGKNGQPKQSVSYMAERVVGTGSFGVVFQGKCLETGEIVAIKKVLQDKRYKNRELQIMRHLDHTNIVSLKHCFYSSTDKDEVYLNLVLEYVPETVYRIAKHYSRTSQRMPLLFVKLYTYQICRALAYIHGAAGVCHRDIKPQNLLVGAKKAPRVGSQN